MNFSGTVSLANSANILTSSPKINGTIFNGTSSIVIRDTSITTSNLVPYSGAVNNVDLGAKTLNAGGATFGESANKIRFTSDGTLTLEGNATVWKDVFFIQSIPKAVGAGNPSLGVLLSSLNGYTYAIGDSNTFDPQEYPHEGRVGGNAHWHLHWISMTDVSGDKGVAWQLETSYALASSPMQTIVSSFVDVTVSPNTPINTHMYSDFPMQTLTSAGPLTVIWAKLTRVSSDTTDPANDPFAVGVHFHYEVDSLGSKTELVK